MSGFPERTPLITGVEDRRDAIPAGVGPWKVFTWSKVAEMAWRAGKAERRGRGKMERGSGWRAQALAFDALARRDMPGPRLERLEHGLLGFFDAQSMSRDIDDLRKSPEAIVAQLLRVLDRPPVGDEL